MTLVRWNKTKANVSHLIFVCVHIRTKKLIVDVIRIQHGETLPEILETPATAAQVIYISQLVFPSYIYLPATFIHQRSIFIWLFFFSLPLSVINYVTSYATYSLRSQSILGLLSAGQSRMLRHQRVWRAAQRFWRTASYHSSRRRGRLSGTFVTWSRLALLLQVTNTRTSSTKYQRFISSSFSQLKMQTRILYLWS